MKKERFKKVLKAFKKRSFYVFIFCNLFATFLHFACNITVIFNQEQKVVADEEVLEVLRILEKATEVAKEAR